LCHAIRSESLANAAKCQKAKNATTLNGAHMASEGYRYTLQRYTGPASRYTCPQCGQRRKFTRYVDTATGEHLAEHVGRCDRQDRCGHHVKPREYFADGGERPSGEWIPPPPPPELPGFRMKRERMERTMGKACHLLEYLSTEGGLDPEQVKSTALEYYVGGWDEPGKFQGAAAFWQVDQAGQVRSAKVQQFNRNGNRVKEWSEKDECMKSVTTWAHSQAGGTPQGFKLEQCLFGEHLLDKYPDAPVGIVEAEKTALVARLFVPSVLWLAVGGLGELKLSKVLPLAGREVYLWPDLGAFDKWNATASELAPLFATTTVVDLLERVATDAERARGLDLADYLLSRNGYTSTATAPQPEHTPAPALVPPPRAQAPRTGRAVLIRSKRGRYASGLMPSGAFAFDATTSATALVLTEREALVALDAWRDVDLSGPNACALVPTLQPLSEWDAMRPA
jgi:hypothetical protein